MDEKLGERPLAPPDMEAHVKEVFPLDMNPEEFAAKDGAGWLDFTFNDYRFRDTELDNWIHMVGSIIRDPKRLEEAQHKYLTDQQIEAMKKYMANDIDVDG